ncbi:3-dehydroquinate dehydratase [Magnetococcus marinus MC-1]|uniref:3-dehydroquinate dehydratase n=1 Tax=Magnetococcus marinus (strain ATCC BAA-1437 / JCM 17883 / MC-1) TaxID=156889 RepID=A0L5E6_MAGMM|nr:type II 3-dehydroquinate dehydratase [Magnetococcus marinus]ABK43189.1 3-dehydroquinate dehydratase [Magnetococcus marinus MC-1]
MSPSKPWRILVLNGPNLNMLGKREASLYGHETLADVEVLCAAKAAQLGAQLAFYQSNYEGALVERIQQAREDADLIVINPAAYTHTSVAIRDALLAAEKPVVEIHISNIHKREPFRHHSYVSDIALGQVVGLGIRGYAYAMEAGITHLESQVASKP